MNDKVRATHLERRAVVYLRQSTLSQVHEHRESTARQYALRQRALELGWPPERIEIIDEDMGQSGTSADWRAGFQRMAEDVAHGRVGAIFSLEVSRLARSSADWHRLLDLCGLADVVLVDEQAVYTPRDYNDRLLLGLKGTMSEAELYWMRLRLQGGKLSKARRGALHITPPVGYEWEEETGRFRFDPDEGVQRAVRLVFERFRLEGSAYAVLRYFMKNGLKLPVREPGTHQLHPVPPRYTLLLSMLHNPTYAGAYVFGRNERHMALVDGQLRRQRRTRLPREAWKVCLKNHHPAYISWEEYEANQKRLATNHPSYQQPDQRGAAREGSALLQGLVLCGRCGHRMQTAYRESGRPYYECRRITDKGMCWTVSAAGIDEAVARLFLETVQPPEIELGLAITREVERQAQEVERQWKLRLERAHYEAQLAERRYKAVDPDNRVVARTLEREWNEKLGELESLEREHQQVLRREMVELTSQDRARLLELAKDLSYVWHARSTTNAERKNLLRILVREVALSPVEVPERGIHIQVLWQTGACSDLTIARRPSYTRATSPETIKLIGTLVEQKRTDREIAAELNRRGLLSGVKRAWDKQAVRWVRRRYGIHRQPAGRRRGRPRQPERRADGLYSMHGVTALLDVTDTMVRSWVEKGWLRCVEGGGPGTPRWYKLDRSTLKRLRAAKAQGNGSSGRGAAQISVEEGGAL
ncbi:recombinase family protein [Vitiosangium sp. GDMCC 1.1324]|uniref:recombinase family protein n=1 Tax=Vitiosangium sp. (strain GDMCC 1.1324) TaxID=2138576 RepID=UPI000D357F7A|nr:recombinase family protein [Vitiosangium sp. GDMCC 1.1324]PTL74904.1 recombinase family protein [Vitiosangium sp. GDMCC 1.1324]